MQTQTKLPKFDGILLVEIPRDIPQTNFLVGDFGKAVLDEVNSRYKDFPVVSKVGNYDNGIVKNSHPYFVVAVNEVIRPEGFHVATQADLKRILRLNILPLRGQYEDSALVLRTEGEPNKYLAKALAKQVRARNPNAKYSLMINLRDLTLEKDQDAPNGLAFKLTEDVDVIYAPVLNQPGNFNSEDIDEKTGLPNKTSKKGDRTLYTRDSGLSRLYLDRDSDLGSYWDDLADSDSDGRVVVMTGEAR